MASKTIATILTLKDNMSKGLIKTTKNISNMSKEAQRASKNIANSINNTTKSITNKIDSIVGKTAKLTTVGAAAAGAFAIKTGFGEAFNMEGYRTQLETAVKDTKKAGQLMKNAVKFANVTPFETGEVVEATAKMEMYGLSSKRWLADVADMAGATNKSIEQATEAMADVTTGEFERIKEFGIRKDQIMLESAKKFGRGVVFNNKGQVLDYKKMMNVIQGMMQKKFKGGADKLAGTTKGLWSTITGITKTSLAKVFGMQDDGTIKAGSLLDKFKNKIADVAKQFEKWQSDGTIDKIQKDVTDTFDKIYNTISKVINFMKDNKNTILSFISAFASMYVAIKVINGLKIAIYGLEIAWAILNGTIALSPIGLIIIAIGALVGVITYFFMTNKKFRDGFLTGLKVVWALIKGFFIFIAAVIRAIAVTIWNILKWLWNLIKPLIFLIVNQVGGQIKNICTAIIGILRTVIQTIVVIIQSVIKIIGGIINFLIGIFTGNWKKAWEGIKQIFIGIFEGIGGVLKGVLNIIIEGINFVIRGLNHITSFKFKGKTIGFTIKEIPKFANGGIATRPSIFGEAGAEMAIPLKRNNRSKQLVKQADSIVNGNSNNNKPIIVNVNVDTFIGTEQFANEVANKTAKKINLILANM